MLTKHLEFRITNISFRFPIVNFPLLINIIYYLPANIFQKVLEFFNMLTITEYILFTKQNNPAKLLERNCYFISWIAWVLVCVSDSVMNQSYLQTLLLCYCHFWPWHIRLDVGIMCDKIKHSEQMFGLSPCKWSLYWSWCHF